MRPTPFPASRCHGSARHFALVALAVMVTLSAVACEDERAPTAPPAAEPRSPAAFDLGALRSQPDDVTVHDSWSTRSPIPSGTFSMQAGTLNGIIYVVGGNDPPRRAVQAYNVATNSWSARRPLPSARYLVNGVSPINGRLYVTGGFNSSNRLTRTLYVYNPATNIWGKKADLPVAGACGAQAVIGGRLYVYAGCTSSGGHHFWRYNAATNTWVTRRPPPTVHQEAAAGVIGGKFYLAGGRNSSGNNLNLDVYNPATNSWVTRASPPVEGPAGGVLNNKLYVVGGSPGGTPLRVYNPSTNGWTTKAPMPTPRRAPAGATADGRLFVIAGIDGLFGVDEVEAYTP